jgi:glycosyltransferase involved in cell wall biosynthesis
MTVKNEEKSIGQLMQSILAQSQLPDEIVIVDGGSTDRTLEILAGYQRTRPSLIRVLSFNALNIAEGRNISIKEARYDCIASADAGVQYPAEWLRNLLGPFQNDESIDIVAGFFEPQSESVFEECVGILLYPHSASMVWEKFLPSGRSAAFRKSVWQALNGYAEWLPQGVGEDADFFLRAYNAGYKFAYAKDATCYWRPRQNFKALFKQYYLYSKGARISGSSAFMLEAYGANPLLVTLDNVKPLMKKGKLQHLVYCFFILSTVFAAKIIGSIFGIRHAYRAKKEERITMTPPSEDRKNE